MHDSQARQGQVLVGFAENRLNMLVDLGVHRHLLVDLDPLDLDREVVELPSGYEAVQRLFDPVFSVQRQGARDIFEQLLLGVESDFDLGELSEVSSALVGDS